MKTKSFLEPVIIEIPNFLLRVLRDRSVELTASLRVKISPLVTFGVSTFVQPMMGTQKIY